jgi:hypothetical protein
VNRRGGGAYVAEVTTLPAGSISLAGSRHWSRASRPETPRSGGLVGVAEDMVLDTTSSSRTSRSGTTTSTPRSKNRSRTNSGRGRRASPRERGRAGSVYSSGGGGGVVLSPYAAIPPEVGGGAEEPDYFLMPGRPALMPGAVDSIIVGGTSSTSPVLPGASNDLRTRSLSVSTHSDGTLRGREPRTAAAAVPRYVMLSPRRRSQSIGSLPIVHSVSPTPRRL